MADFESPSRVRPSPSQGTRVGSWWDFFLADSGGPRSRFNFLFFLSDKKKFKKIIIALICGDVKVVGIVEHTPGWLH